jgi:hypothetical protein
VDEAMGLPAGGRCASLGELQSILLNGRTADELKSGRKKPEAIPVKVSEIYFLAEPALWIKEP